MGLRPEIFGISIERFLYGRYVSPDVDAEAFNDFMSQVDARIKRSKASVLESFNANNDTEDEKNENREQLEEELASCDQLGDIIKYEWNLYNQQARRRESRCEDDGDEEKENGAGDDESEEKEKGEEGKNGDDDDDEEMPKKASAKKDEAQEEEEEKDDNDKEASEENEEGDGEDDDFEAEEDGDDDGHDLIESDEHIQAVIMLFGMYAESYQGDFDKLISVGSNDWNSGGRFAEIDEVFGDHLSEKQQQSLRYIYQGRCWFKTDGEQDIVWSHYTYLYNEELKDLSDMLTELYDEYKKEHGSSSNGANDDNNNGSDDGDDDGSETQEPSKKKQKRFMVMDRNVQQFMDECLTWFGDILRRNLDFFMFTA